MSSTPIRKVPMRLNVLTALAVIGLAASVYLSQLFYDLRSGSGSFKSICNIAGTLNCDAVTSSKYAEIISGLPLSSLTAGWFLAFFFISVIARNTYWRTEALRAGLLMSAIGSVLGVFYIYVMAGVLKTYCLFCLVIDLVNFASLGIIWSMKPESLKTKKLDLSKWKTLAATIAACVFFFPILLKSSGPNDMPQSEINEIADSTLNSNPVAMPAITPDMASVGPADAPVTIVEFFDFQCPSCRSGALILHSVMNRYPNEVRVVFRNFPLDPSCNRKIEGKGHPVACETAKVAVCSHQQGKYHPVYEDLMENQTSLKKGKAAEIAAQHGVDAKALEACTQSPETAQRISKDIEDALLLGVQSTPTFFINGHKVEGAYPVVVWENMIEKLLRTRK
jgi:protein-disulfide isomerase/uncharacterized membrane protein